MYLKYWGLKKFPFDNVADPSFFYLSKTHEEALSRLLYASNMSKGGAMLTGEIGCGKTLLSKIYMKKLKEEGSEVSLLINPPLGSIVFLQEILNQFGVTNSRASKAQLLRTLNKKIIDNMEQNKETIIIIDEAQILNDRTLEEARLLLNFQTNSRFLLTIVLIGQTELRVKIKLMKQLDQRIAIRYHLQPFHFLDTVNYIKFREKMAGFTKNIFAAKAIEKIYQYTGGVPRKINSLCDLSLLVAFNQKRKIINSGIIDNVINELD